MADEKKEIVLTQAGLVKYEEELEYLKSTKREELAQRLKEAIALGDLSENSEYDDAKEEQGHVEARIKELEYILRYARVMDESEIAADTVSQGSWVKIKEMKTGREMEMMLVDSLEANLKEKKMSKDSPVGAAILGHKAGDTVEVDVRAGLLQYKILDVKRN